MGVASFEYPRAKPGNLVYLGPVPPHPSGIDALPAWWADLDGRRPVIHVAQGTLANTNLDELIGPTVRGLADDDALLVVTTGRSIDAAELGPLPENVRYGAADDPTDIGSGGPVADVRFSPRQDCVPGLVPHLLATGGKPRSRSVPKWRHTPEDDKAAGHKAVTCGFGWWPGAGSNRRPSDFQSDARTN